MSVPWPGPDLWSAQIYVRRAAAYHRKADDIPVEISVLLRAAPWFNTGHLSPTIFKWLREARSAGSQMGRNDLKRFVCFIFSCHSPHYSFFWQSSCTPSLIIDVALGWSQPGADVHNFEI
jgi:hypothetical protein